jgi:hypothetical protein
MDNKQISVGFSKIKKPAIELNFDKKNLNETENFEFKVKM